MYDSAAAGGESDKAAAEQSIAAADSAGGEAGADSGDSVASAEMAPEAAPMSGRSEMSSSSESAEATPGAEAYSLESEAAGGTAADDGAGAAGDQGGVGERSAEASSAPSTGSETAAASSSGNDCSLPSLAAVEWAAAVTALPPDVTTTRLPGRGCQTGALRGNGIEVLRGGEQTGALLWIVVSDGPIGRDGAATNSTVVSATHGEITVTVIANQSGDPWLDEAALLQLVDAVAAAG